MLTKKEKEQYIKELWKRLEPIFLWDTDKTKKIIAKKIKEILFYIAEFPYITMDDFVNDVIGVLVKTGFFIEDFDYRFYNNSNNSKK